MTSKKPMSTKKPSPPEGTEAPGRRLWKSVTDAFELEEHELVLLRRAVRVVDVLDELDGEVERSGVLVSSPQGERTNPALVERRQQEIVLARILASLRLPQGEEGDQQANARPQRRVGARGTYGLRSVK